MALERVANEQDDIGVRVARRREDARESGGAIAAMEPRIVIVVDVNVGGMNDDDIPV
jgi:hypothetical protein